MDKGDIVKFKNETDEEKNSRTSGKVIMRIVWIDGDRAMVESDIREHVNPTSIYNLEDLELAQQ